MTITIDYGDPTEYIINIPKTDMVDVTGGSPTEIRELNVDSLRITLGDIQDEEDGISYTTAYEHTPPLTISGVTLARVVEILSPFVILFEDLPYNVNVVGGNSNVSDVVIKNQVGVNTANSAGLQDPFALQSGAFGGEVALDVLNGQQGTTFPLGTRAAPVNNVTDALNIAVSRGLVDIVIISDTTLSSGDFSSGYNFIGTHPGITLIINAGCNVTNCSFSMMVIEGDFDGGNTFTDCSVENNVTFNGGTLFQCGMSGVITITGTETVQIIQCYSLRNGADPDHPLVDFNGAHETPFVLRAYSGGFGLENMSSSTADITLEFESGFLHLHDTLTAGQVVIRGICNVENLGTSGTFVLLDQTITGQVLDVPNIVWDEPMAAHTTADTFGSQVKSKLLTAVKFLGLK